MSLRINGYYRCRTVLLFEGFAGMHVQGTLYVKGETDKNVVFTSKTTVNGMNLRIDAAPYDWNGIDIYETARDDFNNVSYVIRFTVLNLRLSTLKSTILSAATVKRCNYLVKT